MNPHARVSRARRPLAALVAATFLAVGVPAPRAQTAPLAEEGPSVSLRLEDCLAMALKNNLDIAVQRYNIDITATGEDAARAALESLLSSTYSEYRQVNENVDPFSGPPQTSVRGRSLTSSWTDPNVWGGNFQVQFRASDTSANFFLLDPTYQTALTLGYQQSLLRNFGLDVNQAPITIAQNSTRISHEQFRNQVMTTLQATENAYWDLVFARMDLTVKQQSLSLANDLLKMNKAKVEVGTMAPIDVTQAEAGVASREEGVIVSEAAVRNAEDTLRQLLNPPADSPLWTSTLVPSDTPSFEPMTPDPAAAIESAKKSRPELEEQRVSIESNRLQELVDRKATQWDLKVSGNYALEGLGGDSDLLDFHQSFGNALSDLNRTQFADWTLGVQLDIPIGNKAAKARYVATSARLQQSETELQNLELAAEIEVRARVRDVVTNIKRVEAARKNRELQQKNVEAEQKKFDNGMSTSYTVLLIQDDLANAESQENLAVIDYNKSLVALEKSKGTLLEARNVQLSNPGAPSGI